MLATALLTANDTDYDVMSPVAKRSANHDPLAERLRIGLLKTIEAKDHIYRCGDAASHVYQVDSGHVCVYRTLSDGRRQVIDFAYPGDIIGLGAIDQHADSAQAITKVRMRCIRTSTLRQAAQQDGRLGLRLCDAVSRELLASRELLFTVGRCTANERLAAFLMGLSRRNQRNGADPDEFVLPMTRWDIADFLGLTIETVSRSFTKLREEGIIDIEQCVLVTIVDHAALARIAEGQGR
jgi:CRP/FNR family transcriptional regulator